MTVCTAKHHRRLTPPAPSESTAQTGPTALACSSIRLEEQELLLGRTFGPKLADWLDRQNKPTKKATLEATVKRLAEDPLLREQLRQPSDAHPMALVIRRCIDLNLDLGTKSLRAFDTALQNAGVSSDSPVVTLQSFVLLSASSQHPAIHELLASEQFATTSKGDRFIELVLTLEKNNLLGKSQNLAHIYSGLPGAFLSGTPAERETTP